MVLLSVHIEAVAAWLDAGQAEPHSAGFFYRE